MTDEYRSRLQATIAALSYWVPGVSDAARVDVGEGAGFWQLSVQPLYRGACPFALKLTHENTYSLAVAGVSHNGMVLESFDIFLPLVEAISEGRVRQRRSFTANTGIATAVETMIDLGNGQTWSARIPLVMAHVVTGSDDCIQVDQHFLLYSRRR